MKINGDSCSRLACGSILKRHEASSQALGSIHRLGFYGSMNTLDGEEDVTQKYVTYLGNGDKIIFSRPKKGAQAL
jgi:hypothetical protein